MALPAFLVHGILMLAAQVSADSSHGTETTSAEAGGPVTTPLTLWDLGFSLKERWADLRQEEACPVPPDLICIGGGAECGDQNVMEEVALSLHPSETGGAETPAQTAHERDEVEQDLVSFEDWKRRKLSEEEGDTESDHPEASTGQQHTAPDPTDQATVSPQQSMNVSETGGNHPRSVAHNDSSTSSNKTPIKPTGESGESVKPPAHNKYNYASPDCSARIHSSSSMTQHASALLHKSRDRYMLTPCKADEHWVVVELCDEIRIEAIEIAVWEFFSGVVRDVRVSVGGAGDEDDGESDESPDADVKSATSKWEEVGAFVGKNVRGKQVRQSLSLSALPVAVN